MRQKTPHGWGIRCRGDWGIRLNFAGWLAAIAMAAIILTAPAAQASHLRHARTKAHHYVRHVTYRRHYYRYRHYVRHIRGQQAIKPARVEQIQQALINAHYMTGEPDGQWDATTIGAMKKYQADNGWQTKIMPDARALVKLGLGEDYSDAINAKDLTLAAPNDGAPIPSNQEEGFAVASGLSQ